jgi:hypothetical protein
MGFPPFWLFPSGGCKARARAESLTYPLDASISKFRHPVDSTAAEGEDASLRTVKSMLDGST